MRRPWLGVVSGLLRGFYLLYFYRWRRTRRSIVTSINSSTSLLTQPKRWKGWNRLVRHPKVRQVWHGLGPFFCLFWKLAVLCVSWPLTAKVTKGRDIRPVLECQQLTFPNAERQGQLDLVDLSRSAGCYAIHLGRDPDGRPLSKVNMKWETLNWSLLLIF